MCYGHGYGKWGMWGSLVLLIQRRQQHAPNLLQGEPFFHTVYIYRRVVVPLPSCLELNQSTERNRSTREIDFGTCRYNLFSMRCDRLAFLLRLDPGTGARCRTTFNSRCVKLCGYVASNLESMSKLRKKFCQERKLLSIYRLQEEGPVSSCEE